MRCSRRSSRAQRSRRPSRRSDAFRGAGNPAAAYPALRGQHPTYTSIQLKAYRNGARTTDQQSIMRTIAARMSDEQIDSVARYLRALH